MDVLIGSCISYPGRVDKLLLPRVLLPGPAELQPPVVQARAEEVAHHEQFAQVRCLRVAGARAVGPFRVLRKVP